MSWKKIIGYFLMILGVLLFINESLGNGFCSIICRVSTKCSFDTNICFAPFSLVYALLVVIGISLVKPNKRMRPNVIVGGFLIGAGSMFIGAVIASWVGYRILDRFNLNPLVVLVIGTILMITGLLIARYKK